MPLRQGNCYAIYIFTVFTFYDNNPMVNCVASTLSSLSAYKMAARPPRLYKGQWVGMRITNEHPHDTIRL